MFFFITRNIHTGKLRTSWGWLKCSQTGITAVSLWKFCFCASFCLDWNSFLIYIIFWTPTQSLWTHLLSSMPPMQSMWYFCWENTCVLFPLGNKCTSGYATHTAFLLGRHPIYPQKQTHILSCHPLMRYVKGIFLSLSNTSHKNRQYVTLKNSKAQLFETAMQHHKARSYGHWS